MAGHDDNSGFIQTGSSGSERIDTSALRGIRTMRDSPLISRTWQYWMSLRDGADLPRRTALDPRDMASILGHAMILDRVRQGTVRIRLGGQTLNALMGMEVRGLPIRALFDIDDRTQVLEHIEQVFDLPASLELDLISHGDDGLVTGRMLILPLLDAAGQVTKALAVLVTDRIVDTPPRRFQLTNASLVPTHGAKRSSPANHPLRRLTDHHLPVELETGLAEDAAVFESKPSAVPWLRVVK